ncbi:MAG: hypothetical protein V4510_10690 [bacterium]
MRLFLAALLLVTVIAALPPAHAASGPTNPCTTGIAGSWCTVGAADCTATVGYQTAPQQYDYARVHCGPELWAPCTVYADTRGNVETCLT